MDLSSLFVPIVIGTMTAFAAVLFTVTLMTHERK